CDVTKSSKRQAIEHLTLEQLRRRVLEHQATIANLQRQLEAQTRLNTQLQQTVEHQRKGSEEHDRIVAELVALRRARGKLPRTVGDLRNWRAARGLTQAEAAELLHVGRATIERAEAQDAATPLRGVMHKAFTWDAELLDAAEDEAREW